MQRLGKFATLIGAVLAQLLRYLFGNVANPAFGEVKSNDANRAAVLSFQQILDDSVKIGIFNVCFAPGTTHSAESLSGNCRNTQAEPATFARIEDQWLDSSRCCAALKHFTRETAALRFLPGRAPAIVGEKLEKAVQKSSHT